MKAVGKTLIRIVNDKADSSCLNLGLGEPGFPTPPSIVEHVRKHIGSWRLGYTPNEGLGELRAAVAAWESAACGADVPAERVCITVGSEEALFAILMIAIEAGEEVLVPDPGYPSYASIVRLAGGCPVVYPLAAELSFRLRAGDVLSRITSKTRAIVLNSPNNPAGAVYEESELVALAAGLAGSGILILSDECYRALSYDAVPASIFRHYENTVLINSLSKSHCMTGWRLGWAVVPSDILPSLAGFHQLAVTCASAVSQRAAIFVLGGGAEMEQRANIEELRKRRQLALSMLKESAGLTAPCPGGAFYLFAQAPAECARAGGSLALCLRLIEEEKTVIIPGAAFGRGGEGYLRISFAAPQETIVEGLTRLSRFLNQFR
jgi:aspartate/methionine/tyrosine aminotransferase